MHWETAAGYVIQAPSWPYCITGTNYDVTLTLVTEADETLTNSYLYLTAPSQFGYVFAKRHTDASYVAVGIPFDATCFLGYIPSSGETEIDFRLTFPVGTTDGNVVIPVAVGHDDAAQLPNPYFEDDWPELWADDWADQELWSADWRL